MTAAPILQQQAETCLADAHHLRAQGALEQTIETLRRAMLLYAAADEAHTYQGTASINLRRSRADACQEFGDCLAETDRHAEAANVYQEATDLYLQIGDPEAEEQSRQCARKVLASVAALRTHPRERLHLLIARYERIQQQLALESGTEAQQAECSAHIGLIFQRRERPEESIARYREALDLYGRAAPTPETELARAECHHRIATQLSIRLGDLPGAAHHYRQAIALYSEHEPAVYGVQSSLEICRDALARVEAAMRRGPDPLPKEK